MMSLRAIFVVLLATLCGHSLIAQQPPEQERGFKPDGVYQFNGFDSVNLFNGNLNLAIPIASYTVSADVSYSFALRYAGNVWNANEHCPPPPEGGTPVCETRYFPQRDNAGMGWGIEFQELFSPLTPTKTVPQGSAITLWRFKSSDSGEHYFFETLHEPKCSAAVTADCDSVTAGVFYTRDGTYIRLKDGAGGAKILEFPNGERRRFAYDSTYGWRLQYIYGVSSTLSPTTGIPQTNWVKYEYVASTTHTGILDWHVTDSLGREHTVFFQPAAFGPDIVDKIRVAAFQRSNDSSPSAAYAEYDLTYDNYAIVNGKPVDGSPSVVVKPCQAASANTASVRFLTRIDLPSGEIWQFSYAQPTTSCDDASATLTQAILPTLGRLNWTYQSYGFSSDTADKATGVFERTQNDPAGNQVQYTKYLVATGANSGPPYTTTVEAYAKTEAGLWKRDSKVVNYFDRVSGPSMGLPYTTTISDSTTPTLKLSSETFDCDATNGSCPATPERRQYVTYEMDYVEVNATVHCNLNYPCARDRNRRMVAERTRYVTDANHYADTNYSLFDGLGHYRKTVTDGDFSSGNIRTAETNYNSNSRDGGSVGTYKLTTSGTRAAGYTSLLSSDPWILGTFGNMYSLEDGVRADVLTCFDMSTGFLKRKRTLASTTNDVGENDLLSVFTRDSATGFVSREEYFGGDKRASGEPDLSLGDVCTLTLPVHDEYSFRIDHTYQFGALATSTYAKANGTAMPFVSVQNAIDLNTGLVASSTDPAGVVTKYRYDRSRRLDLVDRDTAGLADTSYTFAGATTSAPASVTVTTGTGTTSTSVKYEFDAFGRLWREHRLMPDATWSVVETQYDTLGRRSAVSERETYTNASFTPAHKTEFKDYDVFGRIGRIRTSDEKETTITYTGERLTTRRTEVATSVGGVTAAITEEERDRAGRLVKITENGGDVTTYTYDPNNHMTSATVGSQPARVFTYDGRGFLVSEQHPESGTTDYQYDARGHVVTRAGAVATLKTDYDRAERVLSVTDDGTGPLAGVLKEFSYDRANATDSVTSSTDYSMGKLAEAIRHNRSDVLGDVQVQETYTYATRLGLLSRKDTTITTVKGATTTDGGEFSEAYEYTDQGNVNKLTYPTCPDCVGQPGPSRTVQTTFSHGLITDVAPYTRGITYHANGLVHEVRHANSTMNSVGLADGPLYTQELADGMARTGSISVSNYCNSTNLQITTQPADGTTVPQNGPADLTVSATGATQWQWYKVNGTSSVAIVGQTTFKLTSAVTADSIYWVRVGNGNCTIDSNQVTVHPVSCTSPTINIVPAIVPRNGTATASVVPISGATYVWSVIGAGATITATHGSSVDFTVGCIGEVPVIHVEITAPCGNPNASKTVSIEPTPTITLSTVNNDPIPQGGFKTIHVAFTGATQPQWTVQWSDRTVTEPTPSSFDRDVYPVGTTNYSLAAAPAVGCIPVSSNLITITVIPPTPTGLTATAVSPSQVNVSWSFSGQADGFLIERRGPGQSSFAQIGVADSSARSFPDTTAAANTAYLYRVKSTKANTPSAPSGFDLATTVIFTPDPIAFHTEVAAQPIMQLRTAVNAVRALWSTAAGPFTFTDPVLTNVDPKAIHILELRTILGNARSSLGLPAVQYTSPAPAPQQLFNAGDINDLRAGVR